MPTPTKWDTLLYLHFTNSATFNELSATLRVNIFFENLNNRMLYKRLGELIDAELVIRKRNTTKKQTVYNINRGNPSLNNYMAFLLWSMKEGLDYNILLSKRAQDIVFSTIGHGPSTLKTLHEYTGNSKNTLKKYIRILERNRFVRIIKQKPLCIDFNLNDRTLFYLTLMQPPCSLAEKTGKYSRLINEIDTIKERISGSNELMELVIKMHIYSTTVTEGNTANKDDVERVMKDLPTWLTPREIVEIRNTFEAVKHLNNHIKGLSMDFSKDFGQDMDLEPNSENIKLYHRILMGGLIEESGEYYASPGKRILGSKLKLPATIEEIEYEIVAIVNFYKMYKEHLHPLLLGAFIHFLLVTVHPFKDGNGRVTRIIHSMVLLKAGYPLFVFDPDMKNRYFDMLEVGRLENLDGFVGFILEEYKNALEELADSKEP
ncbi:MAG: Fic family protein [ANME-2 cluster archaeon]|nr:Fic family protein [ANME-2 cluster archaeon]MBC2700443.1 Fic family protein [ANME-2 cluster archaeon]MBC2707675.1 Fic family protein [ANME-2 cluster archaeon]MBC2748525.1 Fic family protein [ANME-2 cluster archaeon]